MGFREDERAVSGLVGAVILLGVVVILFATYQAEMVPAQNEQVEFEHSRSVQNDMLDLRNAILTAENSGETTFATVKLGTRYPNRLIGINPAPASGALRTDAPASISIVDGTGTPVSNLCPSTDPIQTRILQYSPGYHEYDNAPTIVYENTVLYLNFSGRTILLTDEQLVQGDTVNVFPLNTTFDENGVDRVSVEPVPGNIKEREITDAEITYPTRLSEAKWEQLLQGQVDPADVTVSNGQLTIATTGDVAVSCSPIGLNEAPPGGQRGGAGLDINPAGPNDVEFRNSSLGGTDNSPTLEVDFVNTGNRDTNVTAARVSFYYNSNDQNNKRVGPVEVVKDGQSRATLDILGPEQQLSPVMQFPGNDTQTTFTLVAQGTEPFDSLDIISMKVTFENGATGTYFIQINRERAPT